MDKLNQWLTLCANVGVLLGIIFLAFEIQQNTDAIRSQTRASIYTGAQEELWKNMEYPDITLNMQSSASELSPAEKVRFDAWMAASMRAREFAWSEYQSGNLDENSWESEKLVLPIVVGCRLCQDWWQKIGRQTFSAEYVAFVDELMEGQPPSNYAERVLSIE